MRNLCTNILSAVDTASQTSAAINTNQTISASFLAYFGDATAAGTLKVQASNDPNPQLPNSSLFTPVNWADIPDATASVASGASVLITIASMCYQFVRVVYTRSGGGSTTINVNMNSLSV